MEDKTKAANKRQHENEVRATGSESKKMRVEHEDADPEDNPRLYPALGHASLLHFHDEMRNVFLHYNLPANLKLVDHRMLTSLNQIHICDEFAGPTEWGFRLAFLLGIEGFDLFEFEDGKEKDDRMEELSLTPGEDYFNQWVELYEVIDAHPKPIRIGSIEIENPPLPLLHPPAFIYSTSFACTL